MTSTDLRRLQQAEVEIAQLKARIRELENQLATMKENA